jgi:hypothetical protein
LVHSELKESAFTTSWNIVAVGDQVIVFFVKKSPKLDLLMYVVELPKCLPFSVEKSCSKYQEIYRNHDEILENNMTKYNCSVLYKLGLVTSYIYLTTFFSPISTNWMSFVFRENWTNYLTRWSRCHCSSRCRRRFCWETFKTIINLFSCSFKKLPPCTLAGFDLMTHNSEGGDDSTATRRQSKIITYLLECLPISDFIKFLKDPR